ncbi:MAG: aminodeoxychorismate/anthranilate synthase component II [Pirellulaceae bacterium]|nr:aminodeoxychorismate/anthranilate synthase component II [Pirellulaceae bacterium]
MILLIDNYDSFVYNLARYFERLGQATRVVRNDAITVEQIGRLNPAAVVLSPGPCTPRQAGCSLEVAAALAGRIPLLGVCLGHQTLAEALGGRTVRAPRPMHGRTSQVRHDGQGVFRGLPQPLTVCRYHSLMVDPLAVPDDLQVTAWSDDGVIMALRHRTFPLVGVQFHPEAVLTEGGYVLLANFLRDCGLAAGSAESLAAGERITGGEGPRAESIPTVPVTF